jgi:hypothetical protein
MISLKVNAASSFAQTLNFACRSYLETEVQTYLAEREEQKGIPLGEMVNGLLKQEVKPDWKAFRATAFGVR